MSKQKFVVNRDGEFIKQVADTKAAEVKRLDEIREKLRRVRKLGEAVKTEDHRLEMPGSIIVKNNGKDVTLYLDHERTAEGISRGLLCALYSAEAKPLVIGQTA